MAGITARDLMWEFAKKELVHGKEFATRDAVAWVERNYPKDNHLSPHGGSCSRRTLSSRFAQKLASAL